MGIDSNGEVVERASLANLARGGVVAFGDGYRTKRSELGSSGFPILRVVQVADGFIRPTSSLEYVRDEFRRVIGPKLSRAGDVVLTTKGTFGRRAYVRPEDADYVYSPQVCWFRVVDRARIDPRYLYSWLGSSDFANQAHGMKSSTDMADYLSLGDLARVSVPLPPLPEQRAIAHILGTLDDKIELNRRTNETLEAIARALFKSWFVDFDPVRAKSEGRDPGLPLYLADLFPDSFEESELGERPRGWRIGRFGEVAEQLRDQENPLSSPGALFHHFSLPAFDDGQRPRREYGEGIKSLKSRVPTGVILLSKLNPEIERVWIVDVRPGERAVCSTEFLVLCALSPFTRGYVYCLARSPLFRHQIESLVTGTSKSHQRAQVESILSLPVVVPPSSVIAAFDPFADRLLARTLGCRRESDALAGLRDTLLPRLVSGELRIADAERVVEARL
jgi:type I restriction enzyme, S subunit